MKMKNVNFIEQHIEKMVLAVTVLFFLVALWFFVLNSFSLEIRSRDGQKQVSVMEVETEIRKVAKRLEAALKDENSPLEVHAIQPYAQQFADRQIQQVIEHQAYQMALGESGVTLSDLEVGSEIHQQYLVGLPPAPQQLKAKYGQAVLLVADRMLEVIRQRFADDAHERAGTPRQAVGQYAALVAPAPPRDVGYVSVEAEFDMRLWVDQLQSAPQANRVPEGWWRSRQLLTDVLLERQSRDPATGQWTDETVVAPLPDALSFRHMHDQAFDWPREGIFIFDRLDDQIRPAQNEITRPRFVPITESPVWLPPGEARDDLTPRQQRDLHDILNAIESLEKRRSSVKQRLETRKPKPTATVSPRKLDEIKKLEEQLEEIESKLEKKQAERDELLGVEHIRKPGLPGPPGDRRIDPISRIPPRGRGLPDNEEDKPFEIRVWAHDPTVEPGMTYRYRLRVRVMNPLFRQQRLDAEQKKENFNRLALDSLPTAWSQPVSIEPQLQFFVVDADRKIRQATIEVYRMFNGQRRVETFNVGPGDTLGSTVNWQFDGAPRPVDMQIDALVVDVNTSVRSGLGNNAVLLYYDNRRQRLAQRLVAEDLRDPDLIRCRNQASQARADVEDQSVRAEPRQR